MRGAATVVKAIIAQVQDLEMSMAVGTEMPTVKAVSTTMMEKAVVTVSGTEVIPCLWW